LAKFSESLALYLWEQTEGNPRLAKSQADLAETFEKAQGSIARALQEIPSLKVIEGWPRRYYVNTPLVASTNGVETKQTIIELNDTAVVRYFMTDPVVARSITINLVGIGRAIFERTKLLDTDKDKFTNTQLSELLALSKLLFIKAGEIQ
jgi:hypothetical protein